MAVEEDCVVTLIFRIHAIPSRECALESTQEAIIIEAKIGRML
jgi:hypothetical protein